MAFVNKQQTQIYCCTVIILCNLILKHLSPNCIFTVQLPCKTQKSHGSPLHVHGFLKERQ